MGLPIDKLIVATNENDILKRVINTGEYKPSKVKPSLSPSMDIQVSSNFERLLFDIVGQDDKKVTLLMKDLSTKGFFKLDEKEVKDIQKIFCAQKVDDAETLSIIKNLYLDTKFVLDPHTATALGAAGKTKNLLQTIILGTAHPYKFIETVKKDKRKEINAPSQLSNFMDKEEKFDILENNISKIKKYILEKTI